MAFTSVLNRIQRDREGLPAQCAAFPTPAPVHLDSTVGALLMSGLDVSILFGQLRGSRLAGQELL
jgi:hypothetical protein